MPHRRQFLASLSAIAVSLGAGCLGSVTNQLGSGTESRTSKKGEVAKIYTDGIEEYNAGIEAWDRSISAFDTAEYSTAVTRADEAIDRFGTAQESFSEAEAKARTIGETEAAEICTDAADGARLMGEAARAGRKAARAAVNDADTATINDHVQTAQERREAASQIQIQNTETIESALGM